VIKRFLCITEQFRAFSLPVWMEQRTMKNTDHRNFLEYILD